MPLTIQDLPTEILLDIAELIQCPPYQPSSPSSSIPASGCFPLDSPLSLANLRQLQRCASVCRSLRSVFRPLLWSRVVIMCDEDEAVASDTGRSKLARRLNGLDALLTSHPELGSFVRELGMYIPGDSEGYLSRGGSSPLSSRGGCSEAGAKEISAAGSTSTRPSGIALFPHIASRLTQVRNLTLVSNQLHTGKPAQHAHNSAAPSTGLRVDWDMLNPNLRTGFETIFASSSLTTVQMIGVVAPPRLLFGKGFAPFESSFSHRRTGKGIFSNLKNIILVAHCPMSSQRLEQIDSSATEIDNWTGGRKCEQGPPARRGGIAATGSSPPGGTGRAPSHGNGALTQPQHANGHRRLISDPVPLHTPSSDNLRASFASSAPSSPSEDHDNDFGYFDSAAPLLSLRLAYCDTSFLRYISVLYPSAFANLSNLSLNVIERDLPFCQWFLDQAITPMHDISAGGNLESFDLTIRCNTAPSSYGLFELHPLDFGRGKHGTKLKKLSLRYLLLSQVTESVRRAIEVNVRSVLECRGLERGFGEGERGNKGGAGGLESIHLVVDWTHDGDEILLDAFKSIDRIVEERYAAPMSSASSSSSSNALREFKIEATHWPCMSNCNFRRSVTRTGSSPEELKDEGTLDAFLPFLSTKARAMGMDVSTRYVLENRREGWVL